ncbi:MAG: DUF2147 domain-containing protein [Methyloligellaceae bacterium]
MWTRVSILALAFFLPGGQSSVAGEATGVWLTSQGKAKLRISRCGRGLCSRIIWLRQPKASNGGPIRDERNRNPALRERPVMGLSTFSGLRPSGPGQWSGRIYNPEDGKLYNANLTIVRPGVIEVQGCRIAGLGCGRRTWVRASN